MVRSKSEWTKGKSKEGLMLNLKNKGMCAKKAGNWEANNWNFHFLSFKILKCLSLRMERRGRVRKGLALWGRSGGLEAWRRPPTFVCHPYRGQCGTLAAKIQSQKTTVWKYPCSRIVQMLLAWERTLDPVKQTSCEHCHTLSHGLSQHPSSFSCPHPEHRSCHSQLIMLILLADHCQTYCNKPFQFCLFTNSKMKKIENAGIREF